MSDEETIRWMNTFHCYVKPSWWFISSYFIAFIVTFLNIFMLSITISHICSSKTIKLDTFIEPIHIRSLYLIINLLYTLGPAGFIFAYSFSIGCTFDEKIGKIIFHSLMTIFVHFMTIATMLLYLFFVIRLKRLFRDNIKLKLNKYIYCLLCIAFIVQIVTVLISVYYYLSFNIKRDVAIWNKGLRLANVALSVNIVFVVILLTLFATKIYLLLSSKCDEKDADYFKVLNYSIRYLVLSMICFISTNLINLINIYQAKTGVTISVIMIKNMLMVVDASINMICLYLQFQFTDWLYYKIFCCICCKATEHKIQIKQHNKFIVELKFKPVATSTEIMNQREITHPQTITSITKTYNFKIIPHSKCINASPSRTTTSDLERGEFRKKWKINPKVYDKY